MPDDTPRFHNPFASLSQLRRTMPDPPAATEVEPALSPAAPEPPKPHGQAEPATGKGPARAVVRMERSGRGGKEVTVVEHLQLPARELEVWLKALKAGLGCGGTIEGDAIVIQGDHRSRLPKLLTARGVRKVTIG